MKTTKKLTILCLALVMAVVSVIPSFSWFSHNTARAGYGIYYSRSNLDVANNQSLSMTTVSYVMENNKIKLDAQKNKVEADSVALSVDGGEIQFYKTTITNTASTPAYTGLFLNELENNKDIKIGNDYPTINEQIAGKSERHVEANSRMRIYFEPKGAKGWGTSEAAVTPYLWCTKADGTVEIITMTLATAVESSSTVNKNFASNTATYKNTYYGDLAENTVSFYIANTADGDTADGDDHTPPTGFARTRDFMNFVPQTVYSLTTFTTNDSNLYAACETRTENGAMSVPNYLDRVFVAKGGKAYVSLPRGSKGCTIQYALSASADVTAGIITHAAANFTLDANTALVTDSALSSEPAGGVITTVTGNALGDTKKFVTYVERAASKDNVPICANIKVPASDGEEPGKAVVEWYIDNTGTNSSVDVDPANNLYIITT